MSASFEEKSVWIQLISMVVALGSYFVVAGLMLSRGVTSIVPFVPLFCVAVGLMVVILIVGHAAVAIARRPEGRDERDRLIEWRAESNSGWILGAGVIAAIACLVVSVGSTWVALLLMLSMMVSQVTKFVFQLVYYRRGVSA